MLLKHILGFQYLVFGIWLIQLIDHFSVTFCMFACSKGHLIRVYLESRYYSNDLSHNQNFFYFPTAHSFGFVAFGIVICLCSTQMLYMVEHNVFYCLNLLNWSVASSKHANDTISLSIGALNFVFGVITSLVLLFTGMVIRVVEFSNTGYKIRRTFA